MTTPSSATARADRPAAALGEPVAVEVVLRHDAGARWTLDPAQHPAPFAIRSAGCETSPSGGEAFTRCTLRVARVDLGERQPELSFHAEGAVFTVRLPPIRAALVTDARTPARELSLAGLASPVPLFVPSWRPLGVAAAGLAGALLLALAARRSRRRSAPAPRPPPPAPPPATALLAAIAALEAEELAARGEGRALYFRLAAALRAYVAAASRLPAEALSTAELAARVARQPVRGVDPAWLSAFSAEADRVRFAREEPDAAQCARALAALREVARRAEAP